MEPDPRTLTPSTAGGRGEGTGDSELQALTARPPLPKAQGARREAQAGEGEGPKQREGGWATSQSVVLFDGVCNLCNGTVLFVIDRDPRACFRFAALQTEAARRLLAAYGYTGDALSSIILLEEGRYYTESTAALRIARRLSGGWPLLYGFVLVPRPIRDVVYRWIARNRYRWFGRTDSCRIPTPELSQRFLASP